MTLIKGISIADALVERNALGAVPTQLQAFRPSFTKKSSVSKLKNAELSIFQHR